MEKGRKYRPGDRSGGADQSGLYGRNRGKAPAATAIGQSGFIATIAPGGMLPSIPGPLGYAFRNDPNHEANLDRLQAIQMHKVFTVGGYTVENSGVVIADSAVNWISNNFITLLYPFLHEKAQRRDGYKSTSDPPLSNVGIPYLVAATALTLKVNIRVLAQLYGSIFLNDATRSMMTAFSNLGERIRVDLEASNRIAGYPAGLDPIIDYWSQVYTPYVGGPVVYSLFDFQPFISAGVWAPLAGAFTAWAGNNRPDLTLAADVDSLLDDIELALAMLTNRYLHATPLADYLKWDSLISMTGGLPGGGMPQTASPAKIIEDPRRWDEQMKGGAFHFVDDEGTDWFSAWPDVNGSKDALIHIHVRESPPSPDDILFWIGAKGSYAFDFGDSATPGYAALAEKRVVYGLVHNTALGSPISIKHTERFYTREDGWIEPVEKLDSATAAGCQAFIWSQPILTLHPDNWRFMMREETEEAYHTSLGDKHLGFEVPFDVFGQAYRKWMFDIWGLPFIF